MRLALLISSLIIASAILKDQDLMIFDGLLKGLLGLLGGWFGFCDILEIGLKMGWVKKRK
uniref:Uncharacterized protein n=1 Tax=viral metagenome TaxID=1070528 RepID=A0A6M3JSW5_9ZZZZ